MIKYFCDKCGCPIDDTKMRFNVKITCSKLLNPNGLKLMFCEPCAIEFVGADNVKEKDENAWSEYRDIIFTSEFPQENIVEGENENT